VWPLSVGVKELPAEPIKTTVWSQLRLSKRKRRIFLSLKTCLGLQQGAGLKSSYRGLDAIDFRVAARSVLLVGRLKSDPTVSVVAHDKSSLAPEGKSIAFSLDAENGFQ
jgi:hypothetical protein